MICHPFDTLMELDTKDIRLDCAALHLARDVYPHLVIPAYLARLDAIAREVADLRPGLSAALRYEAMRRVVVGEYKLRGNQEDYYDPENSYLNRVLDRGVGIPITLSVVWLEVARRLKWPVAGLRFPGHFIIRFDDDEHFVLVDPFREGRTLAVDDCRRILDHHFDGKVAFAPEFLQPADTRSILVRLLKNLRNIYVANRDWRRVAEVLRRLVAVEPDDVRHLDELAGLLHRHGDIHAAYAHLSVYLQRHSNGDKQTRQRVAYLEALIASLN
jgi:regulator of sirC expression with transglutaminase-like and TPR domain